MDAMQTLNEQVVVSMTSFPEAIPYAEKTIPYILRGSVLPDKLVIYLTLSRFEGGRVPESLRLLCESNPIVEVRDRATDIGPYQKLVPALADFPEAVIVTIDDDIAYHRHMLRDLLRMHAEFPGAVLAHRAKRIKIGKPYRGWSKYRWYDFLLKRVYDGPLNLPTGVAGVLYPPHCLRADMLDPEIFTKIAPSTDDVWFWAAATAAGTPVIPVPFGRNKPRGLHKPKKLSLKTINFKGKTDRNASALEAILERYPEIGLKISGESRPLAE